MIDKSKQWFRYEYVQLKKPHNNQTKPTLLLWRSSKLEEVTKRGCSVSVFGDTQNPLRHGSEQSTQHDKQWSWMRWSPEASLHWLCESTQPPRKTSRLLETILFQIFRRNPHDTLYHINTTVAGFENNLPKKPYHPQKWPCKPTLSSGHQKLNGQLSLLWEKTKRKLTDRALPLLDRPYWSSVRSAPRIEKIMHFSPQWDFLLFQVVFQQKQNKLKSQCQAQKYIRFSSLSYAEHSSPSPTTYSNHELKFKHK